MELSGNSPPNIYRLFRICPKHGKTLNSMWIWSSPAPWKKKRKRKKVHTSCCGLGTKIEISITYFLRFLRRKRKSWNHIWTNSKDMCNQIKTPQYLPDINLTMKYRDPVCLISLLQSFQYWPGTVISEEMIMDRIVFGIQSEKIREKLINVGNKRILDDSLIR